MAHHHRGHFLGAAVPHQRGHRPCGFAPLGAHRSLPDPLPAGWVRYP